MAAKSPKELIGELHLEVTKLIAELNGLRDEVRRAELLNTRDRLIKLESVLDTVDIPAVLVQLGVIQEQVAKLKKWRDENERQRVQYNLVFMGCLLTVFVQIVIVFIKK